MTSSLKKNLTASTGSWRSPKGPTRLGPGRSWMSPAPRRSAHPSIGTTVRITASGIRTRSARMSQSVADKSDRPDGDEGALLHQDAALQFFLRHVRVSLDLRLDLPAQVSRRPVAVAVAQRDGEQQQKLPVRADRGPGQECAIELLHAALDVGEGPFLLCQRSRRQDDVGGTRQGVGGPRRDRQEAGLAKDGDLLRIVRDLRERRVRHENDSRPRLPRQHVLEAVASGSGRETHVLRAGEVGARMVSLHPDSLGFHPAKAGLVHDGVAIAAGEVVGDFPKEEVLLVGEVGGAEEKEAGRPRGVHCLPDLCGDLFYRAGNVGFGGRVPLAHRGLLDVAQIQALGRSEEHTSELQSRPHLVCRLLLEKKKKTITKLYTVQKKKTPKKNR